MTSLERIARTVRFLPADRVPVIAQVFGCAATLAGVDLERYLCDGEILAQCQLAALRRCEYDAVFTVMDANVETEAVGSILNFRPNRYPIIERHALSEDDDWNALAVPDPKHAGRMPEMLKAIGILKQELRDEKLIVGCVLGPFTLATQLLGTEAALYMAIDDPQRLGRLMDFATDVIIRFGMAQLQAGAHLPIVFDPSASQAVVPPQFFREFELPRLGRVFQAFGDAGAAANWLHIAGPVNSILPYYPQAGVQIANFDYCVTPSDAAGLLPATCLDGNIRPLAFLEESPADIHDQATDLLGFFGERGGFILSSGCEIPLESPADGIAAMVDAACTKR